MKQRFNNSNKELLHHILNKAFVTNTYTLPRKLRNILVKFRKSNHRLPKQDDRWNSTTSKKELQSM